MLFNLAAPLKAAWGQGRVPGSFAFRIHRRKTGCFHPLDFCGRNESATGPNTGAFKLAQALESRRPIVYPSITFVPPEQTHEPGSALRKLSPST